MQELKKIPKNEPTFTTPKSVVEPVLVRLDLPDEETSYENLLDAEMDQQSQRLDLTDSSSQIEGLISAGFTSCFAIIIRSDERISLRHISSPSKITKLELEEEVLFVSKKRTLDYTIQLARAADHNYAEDIVEGGESRPAEQYFPETAQEISRLIQTLIGCTVEEEIIIMQHGLLLIDKTGKVNTFEEVSYLDDESVSLMSPSKISDAKKGPASSFNEWPHFTAVKPPKDLTLEEEDPEKLASVESMPQAL